MRRLYGTLNLLGLVWCGLCAHRGGCAEPGVVPIAAVRELPFSSTQNEIPVTIRGLVTCFDSDWNLFFVNDESGTIYVDFPNSVDAMPPDLKPGDWIEVSGQATPGWTEIPYIATPSFRLVESDAPIPPARRVTHAAILAGTHESQWVSISGIVRMVHEFGRHVGIDVYSGESPHWLRVWIQDGAGVHAWLDQAIRIQGVCLAKGQEEGRITRLELYCPGLEHITPLSAGALPPVIAPPSLPRVPHVPGLQEVEPLPDRLQARGMVTYVGGNRVFITDGFEELEAQLRAPARLVAGDCVRISGRPEQQGNRHLKLTDAEVEALDRGQLPPPLRLERHNWSRRTYHGLRIELEAYLFDRWEDPAGNLILGLKWDEATLTAALPRHLVRAPHLGIQPDSLLQIRGIASHWDESGKLLANLTVLPGAAEDIMVLHAGSWWTPTRRATAWTLVVCLLALMLLALINLKQREKQARDKARWLREQAHLQRRLGDLVNQASDFIFTLDAGGLLTSTNRAGETITGLNGAQLTGLPFKQLLAATSVPVFEALLEPAADSAATLRCELQLRGGTHEVRFLDISFIPIMEQGRRVGIHGIGRDITGRKLSEVEFEEYRNKLNQMSTRLALAEEEERRRISRDLHDLIGQTLSASQIKLGRLLQQLENPGDQELIRETRGLINETIQATRSLVFELSPPVLEELGILAALDWLAEKWTRDYGLHVALSSEGAPVEMDRETRLHVFRITRELLVNIVKHAGATQATLSCTWSARHLEVTVGDDGRGFDVGTANRDRNTSQAYGLFSIRDTLNWINGSLDLDSIPGQGTWITFRVPVKQSSQPADRQGHG